MMMKSDTRPVMGKTCGRRKNKNPADGILAMMETQNTSLVIMLRLGPPNTKTQCKISKLRTLVDCLMYASTKGNILAKNNKDMRKVQEKIVTVDELRFSQFFDVFCSNVTFYHVIQDTSD